MPMLLPRITLNNPDRYRRDILGFQPAVIIELVLSAGKANLTRWCIWSISVGPRFGQQNTTASVIIRWRDAPTSFTRIGLVKIGSKEDKICDCPNQNKIRGKYPNSFVDLVKARRDALAT